MSDYFSSGSSSYSYQSGSTIASDSTIVLNEFEAALIRSNNPIDIREKGQITVNGQTGIWCNKNQCEKWKGDLNLSEYEIFNDPNPQIIYKKPTEQLQYVQELAIKYLRPPTPPTPGEIIITQEADEPALAAPPIIIRQEAERIPTPEPLIIREMPPLPPKSFETKHIKIPGKKVTPPRKVIIERIASEPAKPQNVIIERWLPYKQGKRRVVFNKVNDSLNIQGPKNNLLIQWEAPEVQVKKVVKYLGVEKMSPDEYIQSFGDSLKTKSSLPEFVHDIETPSEVGRLAADVRGRSEVHELHGDLEGFRYIDMDKEGLNEYKRQLIDLGVLDFNSRRGSGSSIGSKTILRI